MLQNEISWLVDIGMAVGPILGYVSQYRLIKANSSIGSFSIDICAILLVANILRLNFYIFEAYKTALVFQSLLMIAMQILLVYECSKHIGDESGPQPGSEQITALNYVQSDHNAQNFWRWQGFEKYGVSILFFVFCSFAISGIFYLTPISYHYGAFIGLVALTTESALSLPQIIRNYKKKSTQGLSYTLVTLNLVGDIGKLTYFIINKQPFQFILCGSVQILLDFFVICQIFYYKSKAPLSKSMRHSRVLQPKELGSNKNTNENEQYQGDQIQDAQIQIQTQQAFQRYPHPQRRREDEQTNENKQIKENKETKENRIPKILSKLSQKQGYSQFNQQEHHEGKYVQEQQGNQIQMDNKQQQGEKETESEREKQKDSQKSTTQQTQNNQNSHQVQKNNASQQNQVKNIQQTQRQLLGHEKQQKQTNKNQDQGNNNQLNENNRNEEQISESEQKLQIDPKNQPTNKKPLNSKESSIQQIQNQ